MQRVKCFLADTTVELENQINDFIHNNNIEITHITYSHLSGDSRALIVYDEKKNRMNLDTTYLGLIYA